MNLDKINIWDLGSKINIKVNNSFIDFVNDKIKSGYQTKRKIHAELIKFYKIPFSTFKVRMKRGYKYFIDLEILLNLCKILNIPFTQLQENITAYKTRGGYNYIENPKLPIEITPIFDMLIAHHIGDGTVVDPKRNRKPYFSYRQYNQFYMQLYIKKMESVFGKIQYKNPYQDKTRSYCPAVISEIIFNQYGLNTRSFLSETARIPEDILSKERDHLIAFLLGFIIDEGYIDSTCIVIGLKNPQLARDLQKLCHLLGYKSKFTEPKKYYGYLYILKEGVLKLWHDYKNLLIKYPEVNLGWKGQRIEESLKISERLIKRTPGNNKVILNLISQGNFTINEISNKIQMTRQGVRYHMKALEQQKKIRKIGIKGENNYIYTFIPEIKLKER